MQPVGVSHYLKKMTWYSSGFKFIRAISPQHTFILFLDVHFFLGNAPQSHSELVLRDHSWLYSKNKIGWQRLNPGLLCARQTP